MNRQEKDFQTEYYVMHSKNVMTITVVIRLFLNRYPFSWKLASQLQKK